jgi:hypothetical protein
MATSVSTSSPCDRLWRKLSSSLDLIFSLGQAEDHRRVDLYEMMSAQLIEKCNFEQRRSGPRLRIRIIRRRAILGAEG